MLEEHRDPGKLNAIGTALVIAAALVTGVVVSNWKDKGAGVGGIVGAAAGTLYGLNEANQKDTRAVAANRACLMERGYSN